MKIACATNALAKNGKITPKIYVSFIVLRPYSAYGALVRFPLPLCRNITQTLIHTRPHTHTRTDTHISYSDFISFLLVIIFRR